MLNKFPLLWFIGAPYQTVIQFHYSAKKLNVENMSRNDICDFTSL